MVELFVIGITMVVASWKSCHCNACGYLGSLAHYVNCSIVVHRGNRMALVRTFECLYY